MLTTDVLFFSFFVVPVLQTGADFSVCFRVSTFLENVGACLIFSWHCCCAGGGANTAYVTRLATVKNTTTSTTPVPGGKRQKLLHFPKTYSHKNKLRNQHLSAAQSPQKTEKPHVNG
jgi:hypothetical protein